jgi:hypothetical protein
MQWKKSLVGHYVIARADETNLPPVPLLKRQRIVRERRQNIPIDDAD